MPLPAARKASQPPVQRQIPPKGPPPPGPRTQIVSWPRQRGSPFARADKEKAGGSRPRKLIRLTVAQADPDWCCLEVAELAATGTPLELTYGTNTRPCFREIAHVLARRLPSARLQSMRLPSGPVDLEATARRCGDGVQVVWVRADHEVVAADGPLHHARVDDVGGGGAGGKRANRAGLAVVESLHAASS